MNDPLNRHVAAALASPLAALLGAALLSNPAPAAPVADAAPSAALRQDLDVRYGDAGKRQAVDVFAPANARRAPVVLLVHGGSWVGGDKDFWGLYRNVGKFLADNGLVAVVANYRLSPSVRHPEQVMDVARAFAWVRRHAATYGGDPERIFLCGHSAGGHLVALLATDDTYLKSSELKLNARDRAALRGVIGVSGVYRIPGPDEYDRWAAGFVERFMRRAGTDAAASPVLNAVLLQAGREFNPFRLAFGSNPDVCKQASPLSHVRAGLPPFLLLYAERDIPALPPMAREFARALRQAGDAVELVRAAERTHNSILFRAPAKDDPVGQRILAFIQTHSGPRP
jgi:acetyl esterase/lipase